MGTGQPNWIEAAIKGIEGSVKTLAETSSGQMKEIKNTVGENAKQIAENAKQVAVLDTNVSNLIHAFNRKCDTVDNNENQLIQIRQILDNGKEYEGKAERNADKVEKNWHWKVTTAIALIGLALAIIMPFILNAIKK